MIWRSDETIAGLRLDSLQPCGSVRGLDVPEDCGTLGRCATEFLRGKTFSSIPADFGCCLSRAVSQLVAVETVSNNYGMWITFQIRGELIVLVVSCPTLTSVMDTICTRG